MIQSTKIHAYIHTYIHTYIHNLYLNTIVFKAIKACGVVTGTDRMHSWNTHPFSGFRILLKGQVECSLIKLLFSNLLLILSFNNPTHMYLSDLRMYFKVEVYFGLT